MLIGIGVDMAPLRSKDKVARVHFVKQNVNMVFAFENCLSQSFYIPHAKWSW